MGFVGGTLFTAFRGYRNAPSPFKSRLWGMQNEVRFRAPVIGVQFAAWGGVFSICDCTLVALRKKVCQHKYQTAANSNYFLGGCD